MHYSYKFMKSKSLEEERGECYVDSNVAAKLVKSGFNMQEKMEYNSLLQDLASFDEWCIQSKNKTKACFFEYFQDAIIGAYYRYIRTKAKAWSKKRIIAMLVCSALLPVISTALLHWLTNDVETFAGVTGFLLGGIWGAFWLVLFVFYGLSTKRAYEETWVRHSLCYTRLHLALSIFLTSERSDESYTTLVSDVFTILEQNVDQFALNMNQRGMAPRSQSNEKKG